MTYRYPAPSALVAEGRRLRIRLATSGGPTANPQFFAGRLLVPVVASDLLLTLGDVARSRFHLPAQMLRRILELADPVAACADERLRFEAFSAPLDPQVAAEATGVAGARRPPHSEPSP